MESEEINEARRLIHGTRDWILGFEAARHREDVRAFRDRWLPDGELLPQSEARLKGWIGSVPRQKARKSPASETYLGTYTFVEIDTPRRGRIVEAFPYPTEGRGDLTDEFRRVAAALAAEYGWHESSAAAWMVMEDIIPRREEMRVYVTNAKGEPVNPTRKGKHQSHNLYIRVIAPIDTPTDRITASVRLQQKLYAGNYAFPVPSKTRPYEDPTLESLRFALERNDGRTWIKVLQEWNTKNSDWKFEESTEGAAVFGKNIRRAYRQIMGRKLDWKRRPGSASR